MRSRAVGLLLLVAALGGCSLPLPEGVRVHRGEIVEDSDPGDIQVLPPGPVKGAAAEAVVRGFLGAESSPEGGHAIARRFLAKGAVWATDQVRVYDPASLRLTSSELGTVEVSFTALAQVNRDGRHLATPRTAVTETYLLAKDGAGEWRITVPPVGLRLTPADRERSFPARSIYFVRPSATAFRVVPDQVLLPGGGQRGRAELDRLLSGPSSDLAGSVSTAFPPGTRLLSVDDRGAGIYDVTLSDQVKQTGDLQRQQLSAQIVWTLRDADPRMRGVRILVDGEPLRVPGEGPVQRHDDWNAFDPDGVGNGPSYFVVGGRLHTLADGRASRPVGPLSTLAVDDLAVTPSRDRIALLHAEAGAVTVRIGDLTGSAFPQLARGRGLSSPSWGAGERGLWLLDGSGRVLVLANSGQRFSVPVVGLPGPLTALEIARDGSRAALVSRGRLFVGRIEGEGRSLQIRNPRLVTADLTGVSSVAWRDASTLVALGALSSAFVPVVVSVDGSSLRPLPVAGLPARPEQLAASSLGTIVTGAGHLYVLGSLGFRQGPRGQQPVFPG